MALAQNKIKYEFPNRFRAKRPLRLGVDVQNEGGLWARCTTIVNCDSQSALDCESQIATRNLLCTTVSDTLIVIPNGVAKCKAH